MSNNANGFCNFAIKTHPRKRYYEKTFITKGVINMTDNSSKFNPVKSAGALLLAVLMVVGSVLTVAAAAASPAAKAESDNNVADGIIYNNLCEDGDFHVLSAYEVTVKNNGQTTKVFVSGGTVADVLEKAGVQPGENQVSVPAASTAITSDTDVVIMNAKKISVTADGKTQDVLLPYGKVGESLILAGIRISPDDILSVDRNTRVDEISELSVKRVIYKNVSVTEEVPFESKKENSDEIELGEKKLKTEGVNGEKLVTKRVKYIDGEKSGEKVISEKVTKAPVKPAPKPTPKPTPKPAPKTSKKITYFAVNEHVVYPIQGVGEIKAIEKRLFREKQVLYYDIYFETPDMTVMVPVENAESIGLRKIVSSKEAAKALELLNKEYEQANTDWKTRNQQNLDLLKKGTISDIAQVVKTLYDRSTSKELPIQERKLFDNASKLLIDEVSLALKKSKKDSESMIFEKLAP